MCIIFKHTTKCNYIDVQLDVLSSVADGEYI